jgi:hypothetical protein
MTDEEARQGKNFFNETYWIAPDKSASKFSKNSFEWLTFLSQELNRVEDVVLDLRREKNELRKENEQLKKAMKQDNVGLNKELKKVEEAILDLRREKDALRSENEQLKKAMKQNNEGLSWASKLAINQPGKNSSVEKIAVLNTVTQELSEQKRRERKIVITGVQASNNNNNNENDDAAKVKQILEVTGVGGDCVKFTKRLKAKDEDGNGIPGDKRRPGVIVVEMDTVESREKVLAGAKNLKEKFAKVFISKDLTYAERELNYKLRMERNKLNNDLSEDSEYLWIVSSNRLIKTKKRDRLCLFSSFSSSSVHTANNPFLSISN